MKLNWKNKTRTFWLSAIFSLAVCLCITSQLVVWSYSPPEVFLMWRGRPLSPEERRQIMKLVGPEIAGERLHFMERDDDGIVIVVTKRSEFHGQRIELKWGFWGWKIIGRGTWLV